ncbi:MAG: hypothetical protein HY455_02385, partial [Parcubacteria group bacterium]|nr:hypothetical protein [Parcubacteria group bacterium]
MKSSLLEIVRPFPFFVAVIFATLIASFFLGPMFASAANTDAVLQVGTTIIANDVTVTVTESSVDSITVNDGNFTVQMSQGTALSITAATRNKFTVSPTERVEATTCTATESTLVLKGPGGDTPQTVTVTPSSETGAVGGGGGGGGGG